MSANPFQVDEMTAADLQAVVALEQGSFKDPWPLESFIKELNIFPIPTITVL